MSRNGLLDNFNIIQKEARKYSYECDKVMTNLGIYFLKIDDVLITPKDIVLDELVALLTLCIKRGWFVYVAKSDSRIYYSKIPSEIYAKKNDREIYLSYKDWYRGWVIGQISILIKNTKETTPAQEEVITRRLDRLIRDQLPLSSNDLAYERMDKLLVSQGCLKPSKKDPYFYIPPTEEKSGIRVYLYAADSGKVLNSLEYCINNNLFFFITTDYSSQSLLDVKEVVRLFYRCMGANWKNLSLRVYKLIIKHLIYTYPDDTYLLNEVSNRLKGFIVEENALEEVNSLEKHLKATGYKYLKESFPTFTSYYLIDNRVTISLFSCNSTDVGETYVVSNNRVSEFIKNFNLGIVDMFVFTDELNLDTFREVDKVITALDMLSELKLKIQKNKLEDDRYLFIKILSMLLLKVRNNFDICYKGRNGKDNSELAAVFNKNEGIEDFIQRELKYLVS